MRLPSGQIHAKSLVKTLPFPAGHATVCAVSLPGSICERKYDENACKEEFDYTLTAANLSSNVEGSMLGNNLRATGNNSSMNGTMMKTANGTSLRMSCVVRLSYSIKASAHRIIDSSRTSGRACLRSRLVRLSPCKIFHCSLAEIRTSETKSFDPCQ